MCTRMFTVVLSVAVSNWKPQKRSAAVNEINCDVSHKAILFNIEMGCNLYVIIWATFTTMISQRK